VCDVPDAASKLQTKQGQITFVGSNIIAPMSVSAQQSTDGATIVVRVVVSPAERERERERERPRAEQRVAESTVQSLHIMNAEYDQTALLP
jgi:bifunctional N-acetylglucosamine-1-phosphate-uridyltransferase/glucosamine-1-phosphate-acetyltransferase GlmU-like protein